MRKLFPNAHWEPARGTPEQNVTYCSKSGDFSTIGTIRAMRRGPATTSDDVSAAVIELSKRGSFEEIATTYPRVFLQRYSTIRAISKDFQNAIQDSPWTRGVWIWGESGVGKSRLARLLYTPFYAKMANKWFDGYDNEPYIILDDVGPDQAKSLTYHLKIWTDRYAFVAEIKNGARRIAPMGFIITSQYRIETLWPDTESCEALLRRCTVIHLGEEHDGGNAQFSHFRWPGVRDATTE